MLARGLAKAFPALNVLEVRGTALFSPLVGEAEAALRDIVKRVRLRNYLSYFYDERAISAATRFLAQPTRFKWIRLLVSLFLTQVVCNAGTGACSCTVSSDS